MPKSFTYPLLLIMLLTCCSRVPETGVTESLAVDRRERLTDISYRLGFDLRCPAGEVLSADTVSFGLSDRSDVLLDFKADSRNLSRVRVNGRELIPEIQATGDIFFPSRWCKAILENQHDNPEVSSLIDGFLDVNKDMNPLLVNKILQAR